MYVTPSSSGFTPSSSGFQPSSSGYGLLELGQMTGPGQMQAVQAMGGMMHGVQAEASSSRQPASPPCMSISPTQSHLSSQPSMSMSPTQSHMHDLNSINNPCNSTSQFSNKKTKVTDSRCFGNGKGTPYIPSYMDLSNGPEPCVVCGDAATGYHYRCMTCEGCKGFFRRTIQKNLSYHCKWNAQCVIDKNTRNQCQKCRFEKCVLVGMATDLVLNERQRVAKRRLIEDNRERRKMETIRTKLKHEPCYHDCLTDQDGSLIEKIVDAYEQTSVKITHTYTIPDRESMTDAETDPEVWQQLAEVMTPSIVKVVEFAKQVPGFPELNVDDQILLLKSCCMEIMCLRAACRYDPDRQTLTLHNGLVLNKNQMSGGGLGMLVEPIFEFAMGLSKLELDPTEIGLLAAVLLMQSDRTGLREPDAVEHLQDAILGAYKRYIADRRPDQPVHWAKILMKVTDLRTISTRHAERVLCIKLDAPGHLPPLFLEMFDESISHGNTHSHGNTLSHGNPQ